MKLILGVAELNATGKGVCSVRCKMFRGSTQTNFISKRSGGYCSILPVGLMDNSCNAEITEKMKEVS